MTASARSGGPERLGVRSRFRARILDLHLYGGLLLSPYLVLYGVSSLQFNHPAGFMEKPRETVEWERDVVIPREGSDRETAESLRDELGLFGSVLGWTITRDASGDLAFELARPGKGYQVQTRTGDGRIEVVERRGSVWTITKVLHGGGRVPGSRIMTLWWLFTLSSVVVVLFSAVSGVYLWLVSKRDRVFGWPTLATAFVSFFGFLLYLIS